MYMLVCFVELLPRNSNELFIYVLALHGGKDDLFLTNIRHEESGHRSNSFPKRVPSVLKLF